jgi:hypothetical protein
LGWAPRDLVWSSTIEVSFSTSSNLVMSHDFPLSPFTLSFLHVCSGSRNL